MHINIGP